MSRAVLVIDMIRGFLEEGYPLYCGVRARKIIPAIHDLLISKEIKGAPIFFICDWHQPNDLEFQMFPPHCIAGTIETEIVPELNYFGYIIHKNRYSAFFNTTLEKQLSAFEIDTLTICGVCTDICVLHTVADARNLDYTVEVPADCVASFDLDAHKFAIQHIQKILGARII
mgnify:CR=1 FL=1